MKKPSKPSKSYKPSKPALRPNSYDPFWEGDRRLEIRRVQLA